MKTLIYLSLFFFSLKCYSQIEQVEIKSTGSNSQLNTIEYDSTEYVKSDVADGNRNFKTISKEHDIKMIKRFVGQEVLVLPKSHKYAKNNEFSFLGYGNGHYRGSLVYDENFYETIGYPMKIYKPVRAGLFDKSNPSFADENDYNHVSDYNSLAGKKFRVTDIVEGNRYYKLTNEGNGDVIYYSCYGGEIHQRDMYNIHPPLLVVGYFEKLKNTYLNEDFIFVNRDIQSSKLTDNNTGQSIENTTNSEWKCKKIALANYSDNPYQKVTFILDNSSGNQIAVELSSLKMNFIYKAQYLQEIENEKKKEEVIKAEQKEKEDEEQRERMADIKEAETIKNKKIANEEKIQKRKDDYINKYGKKFGLFIADGQVKIGMTKEMCIAAIGDPIEKTKQNSVLEKWAYKSKNIYFDKTGILTAIQK